MVCRMRMYSWTKVVLYIAIVALATTYSRVPSSSGSFQLAPTRSLSATRSWHELSPGKVYKRDGNAEMPVNVLSKPLEQFVVSDKFELLFCYIPKNGCTKMKSLFLKLVGSSAAHEPFEKIHRAFSTEPSVVAANLPEARRFEAVRKESWIRAVILRDPLERFLSAYLDKIADKPSPMHFGMNNKVFSARGRDLLDFLQYSHRWNWEPHFKLQSQSCDMQNSWASWNRIFVYDAALDIADATAELLDHRVDGFIYRGWGANSTMWSQVTVHSTAGSSRRLALVREVCENKTLYDALFTFVAPDYQFFNFSEPTLCLGAGHELTKVTS